MTMATRDADRTSAPHVTGGEAFILTCNKTGRFWRHKTEGMARRAASHLGLSDYSIGEDCNVKADH